MTTKDARGREVFGIHPALLAGAATYRLTSPPQIDGQDPGAGEERAATTSGDGPEALEQERRARSR